MLKKQSPDNFASLALLFLLRVFRVARNKTICAVYTDFGDIQLRFTCAPQFQRTL